MGRRMERLQNWKEQTRFLVKFKIQGKICSIKFREWNATRETNRFWRVS